MKADMNGPNFYLEFSKAYKSLLHFKWFDCIVTFCSCFVNVSRTFVYWFCTFFFFQIDVAETLYFWGVTVDTASSI